MVTELLAGELLKHIDVLHDLRLDLGVDLPAILVILGAGLGGDGKALRHGQTDRGHLRQVRALAAQQLAHILVSLGEFVHILFSHVLHPSSQ